MQRSSMVVACLVLLSCLWMFAQWPRDGGTLKPFLQWAGFPWVFAYWERGALQWFDPVAFAADVLCGIIGIGLFVGFWLRSNWRRIA